MSHSITGANVYVESICMSENHVEQFLKKKEDFIYIHSIEHTIHFHTDKHNMYFTRGRNNIYMNII